MLKVLKAGFFTSIQDKGRFGYRAKGVPVSGAMDMVALNNSHLLLENIPNASVLEITMTGPTLLFNKNTYIAITGALMSPTINNIPIVNSKVVKVHKGDILSFGKLEKGFRAYLAVKDGFLSEAVLESQSQYYPLTNTKCIKESQEIDYITSNTFEPKKLNIVNEVHLNSNLLEVQKGPEFTLLNDKQLEVLFSNTFTVSKDNNRMAYQLNETLEVHSKTMLTSATLPGTVQLTPAGKLIILMKDGQTTGGYPRILQLTKAAIAVLAQKKSNDSLTFKLG